MESLTRLVRRLRSDNGCPWDRKQTDEDILNYLIEEVYELGDALSAGNPDSICEELGDVLFHIVFIARLFEEKNQFDMDDVIRRIESKMVHRHPHVFGEKKLDSPEDVRRQWRAIKEKEKRGGNTSILDSVPRSTPALVRAYRIAERAAGAGFDWEDIDGVMEKVEEEWSELKLELETAGEDDHALRKASLEFGDVLFTMLNVARFARIHPETALAESTRKFEKRFRYMEAHLSAGDRTLASAFEDPEEADRLWEEAKKKTQPETE